MHKAHIKIIMENGLKYVFLDSKHVGMRGDTPISPPPPQKKKRNTIPIEWGEVQVQVGAISPQLPAYLLLSIFSSLIVLTD